MPPIPASITNWLAEHYPRPHVDSDWLESCYEWLLTEKNHSPTTDLPSLLRELEEQLLKSDLQDSMHHGTGIPAQFASNEHKGILPGPPVLVEILAITEVGTSAFQLDQIRKAREERLAAGVDEDGEGEGEEGDVDVFGEGPVPKYPRGMLSFELSDGNTVLRGMEYQPLRELSLEKTKLGFKMQLKNPRIHRGTVFLEPECVILKGYETAEREANRHADFARSLRVRMGLPIDNPPPPPPQPQPQPQPPAVERTPLREISPPPSPPPFPQHNDDADLEPRRRKVPNGSAATTSSKYWSDNANPPPGQRKIAGRVPSAPVDLGLRLPSVTRTPIVPPEDEFDFDLMDEIVDRAPSSKGKEKAKETEKPKAPTPDEFDAIGEDDGFNFDLIDELMATNNENQKSSDPPPPPPARQPSPKGKERENGKTPVDLDSDGLYDDEMDVAFLEALHASEMDAYARSTTLSGGSLPSSSASSGVKPARRLPSEVIEIDSDDDMEDKENMPVATRHVRRRVGGGAFGSSLSQSRKGEISGDIINISDSD